MDPEFGKNHAAVVEFEKPLAHSKGVQLEIRLEFSVNTRHSIGRPRLSVTTTPNAGLEEDVMPSNIAGILQQIKPSGTTAAALPSEDRHALMDWWKTTDPGWQHVHAE